MEPHASCNDPDWQGAARDASVLRSAPAVRAQPSRPLAHAHMLARLCYFQEEAVTQGGCFCFRDKETEALGG